MLPNAFYNQIAEVINQKLSTNPSDDSSEIEIAENYIVNNEIDIIIDAHITAPIEWEADDTDEFGWVKSHGAPIYVGGVYSLITDFRITNGDDLDITIPIELFKDETLDKAIKGQLKDN